MTDVWNHSQSSGSDLLVLLAIADFANEQGGAFPAVSTLAKKARMSERNTQRALRTLTKRGELKIEKGKGPHSTNIYRVTICHPDNLSGDTGVTPGVTNPVSRGDTGVTPGVTTLSPNPSSYPSEEPSIEPSYSLSEFFLATIRKRAKTFKTPNLQQWGRDFEAMIREDHRDPDEIRRVIEWCQQHDYWRVRIVSTRALRKNFDQLAMQRGEAKWNGNVPAPQGRVRYHAELMQRIASLEAAESGSNSEPNAEIKPVISDDMEREAKERIARIIGRPTGKDSDGKTKFPFTGFATKNYRDGEIF